MLSERKLARALIHAKLIPLTGPFHRFADFWFVSSRLAAGQASGVLEGLGARMYGGRFTPRDRFETLYLAMSPETARIEAESIAIGFGVGGASARPYVHFTINGLLAEVLDLTEPSIQAAIGTDAAELAAPWRMLQARGKEAPSQRLGRAVYRFGRIDALLYRSTKDPVSGRCLAVFPDRVTHPSWLEIVDDTGRLKSERVP
jgi:RES domain-containing protein